MKIFVDKIPVSINECLFKKGGMSNMCIFHPDNAMLDYSTCKLTLGEKCPYLRVYEEPEPVREYPSYFMDCC